MRTLFVGILLTFSLVAAQPLAQRIAHSDPSQYRPSPAVHGGPGQLNFTVLFDWRSLDSSLIFMHRGIIQPKSGIGNHFHNQCEEMFFIFDGEAQSRSIPLAGGA